MQILDFLLPETATLPLEGDDMVTNKETLQDHETRLAGIETHLGIKPPPPKKTKWERSKEWMKGNPWVAWPLAVTLALLTLFGGYWLNHRREWWNHDVDEQVGQMLNAPNGISQTLREIQQTVNATKSRLDTLEPFIQDVIRHQFDSAAELSPTALQQRLPAVQHLTAIAQNQGVKVEAPVLAALSRNLSTVNPKAPNFWPAIAEFISYRSQSISAPLRSSLPECTDHDPLAPRITDVAPSVTPKFTFSASVYEDCRLTLDSQKDSERINALLAGKALFIECKRCIIVYRGGAVNLVIAVVNRPFGLRVMDQDTSEAKVRVTGTFSGSTLTFTDCIFDFSFVSTPPIEGQNLTRSLLAQSGISLRLRLVEPATHS